jgi:hypothetical protein
MKKLTLDYSQWRCGLYGDYKLGEGETNLLNLKGFMCCLGQFSLQLNQKLTRKNILKLGEPCEVGLDIDLLTSLNESDEYDEYDGRIINKIINSQVSLDAIFINDDEHTTPEEKIRQLQKLFEPHGYEIEVINQTFNNES